MYPTVYRTLLTTALTALTCSLALAQAPAGPSDAPSGGVAEQSGGGSGLVLITTRDPSSYIASADGVALYTLVDDNGAVLPCNAECLQAWPPFTDEATADAASGLDPALVGTTETEDGQTQVTYNDYPLYAFSGDQAPVDVTGQAVEGFGGTWYVIGEDGEPVTESSTTAE